MRLCCIHISRNNNNGINIILKRQREKKIVIEQTEKKFNLVPFSYSIQFVLPCHKFHSLFLCRRLFNWEFLCANFC